MEKIDSLDNQAVLQVSADYAFRDVDKEMVILNTKSGKYITLNEIARSIWLCVVDGKNVSEITKSITAEYDVKEDEAMEDVKQNLIQLLHKEVLCL
jgi:hypothetical protein